MDDPEKGIASFQVPRGRMTGNPIARKLRIKAGMRALIVAAPPGYLKLLAPLPDGVVVSEVIRGTHQFVQFFATRKSEIKKSARRLLKHAARGALVWITYPKKTSGVESDLSREAVWDAMGGVGWRAVAAVAIDEVWSALRFRPAKDVKPR
jgi:predicted SnoaL-like aldol condensation-catalyzing enzyme